MLFFYGAVYNQSLCKKYIITALRLYRTTCCIGGRGMERERELEGKRERGREREIEGERERESERDA